MDGIEFSGVTVLHDFISDNEEASLTETVDQSPWLASQSGRYKQVSYCGKLSFTSVSFI